MTDTIPADLTIASPEQFNAVLAAMLARAREGGVDVRGPWVCRGDGSTPDWEVAVVELAVDDPGDG